MEDNINNIIKKIYGDMEEIKKWTIVNNKKISKIYNKIKKVENKEYRNLSKEEERLKEKELKQKYLTPQLNEYTKIVLSDFESRISILEEENQNYKRMS